jgi:DNA-binding transcriptional MerR regulator
VSEVDGYITRREAAARAGVHENSIRNWEEKGLLKTQRQPRGSEYIVLVEIASLDKILQERHESRTHLSDNERVIVLETENRELRNRLEAIDEERKQLLQELLKRVEA